VVNGEVGILSSGKMKGALCERLYEKALLLNKLSKEASLNCGTHGNKCTVLVMNVNIRSQRTERSADLSFAEIFYLTFACSARAGQATLPARGAE
jgi:hypothetical protein